MSTCRYIYHLIISTHKTFFTFSFLSFILDTCKGFSERLMLIFQDVYHSPSQGISWDLFHDTQTQEN